MKRSVLFFAAVMLLGLGLQSCDKENNNGGGGNNGGNNGGGGNGSDTTSLQWVDLGLPSGLLWADRNVGAVNPEDDGNYYAWGETAPKEFYDWSNYAYGNGEHELTKYCNKPERGLNGFTDNLTTLEASDDAATVNIGGGARTPTKDEWQELLDNTTNTWTTRNGVYGRLFTASNGKSLFLPATGYFGDPNHYDASSYATYYCSSTMYTVFPQCAWIFSFSSTGQGIYNVCERFLGRSVRAVRDNQK